MAITYDSVTTGTVGGGTAPRTITFNNVSLPANSIAVVATAANGGSNDPTLAASGAGLTWNIDATTVGFQTTGSRAAIISALNTSAQTNQTITVTCTGNVNGDGDTNATLYVILGADTTDWIGHTDTAALNDNNPSNIAGEAEVITTAANSVVIFAANDWEAGTAVSPTITNATAVVDQAYVEGVLSGHYAVHTTPVAASGTACRLVIATTNVGDWVTAGVEILQGSASAGAATLVPGSVAVQAIAVTPTPQPVAVTLVPAVAGSTAVAVTAVPQPVTVTLVPASVAFSATAVGPGAVGAATLAPPSATFTAVALTPAPGSVTASLSPATAAFSSAAVAPTPQPVSVGLAARGVAVTAVAVTPTPQPVTVALAPAIATLTAAPMAVGGAGAVGLTVAVGTFSAVALAPAPQPVSVALSAVARPLVAVTLGASPQPVSVALSPAPGAFSARPLTGTPGQVTVTLVRASLALTATALQFGEVGVPGVLAGGDARAGGLTGTDHSGRWNATDRHATALAGSDTHGGGITGWDTK